MCKNDRISEDVFAKSIAEPRLEAYALSPDGTQIAAVVASGDGAAATETLATLSVGSARVMATAVLGPRSNEVHSSMVAFSSNGKSVITGTTTVRVYDAATLNEMLVLGDADTRLVPIRLLSENSLAVIAFAAANRAETYLSSIPILIDVFDVESGEVLGRWSSNQLPFSLSPDGSLLAVSNDEAGTNGCFGFDIVSTRTGKRLVRVGADSVFPTNTRRDKTFGRIVASFLNANEVLVSPDGNVDDSGEPLARSLKSSLLQMGTS